MIDLETGTYIARPPEAPQHSWLLEYIGKCRRGEIIVGKELLQWFDILDDLFNDPEITFELADAHKRIQFIESKCKLYEAPFAGKPFILLLWQKAFLENLYSFKVYDQELGRRRRLFSEFLLLCAKKNGKSPFFAAICLAEFFCGPMGCKILCSSNSYEEAAAMFDGIEAMREESKALEKVTRGNVHGIFFGNQRHKSSGKFSRHNKGNIRKMSAKTGAKDSRNIALGAVDEVWELKDNSTPSFVKKALSSQDEPIYGEITTEGTVEDGYLDDRLKEARKLLRKEIDRPYWMVWLFTQDSETEVWQNEQSWYKSNPSLGIIKKWRYLRDRIEEARTNSAERVLTLCKDFNIKQSVAASWLQEAEIINTATFNIEDFRDCWYIGACDFAETTDLCAFKALLKKPNDPMIYFLSHYWIPNSKLEAPKPEAKIGTEADDEDYRQWEKGQYLTIVPGNVVESSVVADFQFELLKEYGLMPFKVGYDNRFAKDYINRFNELFDPDGSAKTLEMVVQEAKCLNNPMRHLESDLRGKLVNYNNCRGDLVCFRNTGIKMDTLGRIQPAKKEVKKRIDGAAVAVDCYAVYEWHRAEFQTLIEG